MRLVLVIGCPGSVGSGHERGKCSRLTGVGQHLDVEIGQRDHRADMETLAQFRQRGDVPRVVDPRDRGAMIGAYCAGASGFGSTATTVACCANADTMS